MNSAFAHFVLRPLWIGSALLMAALATAQAEAPEPLFEKAHAVLRENCFKCHSHASEKNKGGLVLDSRNAMLTGGDRGPALSRETPEDSLILKAVNYLDPDLQMPPKDKKLSSQEIEALTVWIKAVAPWPGSDQVPSPGVERDRDRFTQEEREWWAFQPIAAVRPPEIQSAALVYNDIDRFIAARLEAADLVPSREADRATLIRRVTFDLTGLPPTPRDVAGFVSDPSPDAYDRLVDRLLATPQYGERMARHWLDLVRYADGDGYRADFYRPDAWRYRDYVIRSFNSDKPYDRFVQEQIAGDELFPENPDAIIATGYLRHGIYEWNARDVRGQWDIMLNDLTDTTGDVFLGLGMQCARCHDHKFDPILQKDYFRLQSFFAPFQPGDRPAATDAQIEAHEKLMKEWNVKTADVRAKLAALEQPYLDKAEKVAVNRFPDDIQSMIRKPDGERAPFEEQLAKLAWRQVIYDQERVDSSFSKEDKEQILALRRELAELEKDKPEPLPIAFAAADVGPEAPPTFVPKKEALGEIEPGILTILNPAPIDVAPLPNSTGRRTALAKWITRPGNPLTTRVIVNRAWQQHFGSGLAANASDFGTLGEKPTHPELLDWLAGWFVDNGSSLKKLHRLMVTSAAYRRSSHHPSPDAARLKDPENRLLWRWTPRRLEAEQIRDALFAVTGELDLAAEGPGVTGEVPRRTIFTRFMRNTREPLADVFDAPQWFTSTASRDTTTTPVQSLLLANSAEMLARGRAFAKRLEDTHPSDTAARIRYAYQLAFGREPDDHEIQASEGFLRRQAEFADPHRLASGQASFVPGAIPYRDGQAAFIEPGSDQTMFAATKSEELSLPGAFTIEAFIAPRSIAEDGALRTIAAKWNGDLKSAGWTLGITGKGSRRKPLTVAMQLIGLTENDPRVERAIFSDFDLDLNKPYFVSAAVTPANDSTPGNALFTLKDLSNADEPLLTTTIEHDLKGGWDNDIPITLGARSGSRSQSFHGLIDDVRLSNAALSVDDLLYRDEAVLKSTLGYWKFEMKPDVFGDSSGHSHFLRRPAVNVSTGLSPAEAALSDFCNALLNSSEFLYIE